MSLHEKFPTCSSSSSRLPANLQPEKFFVVSLSR
jgi:hypothetical protein